MPKTKARAPQLRAVDPHLDAALLVLSDPGAPEDQWLEACHSLKAANATQADQTQPAQGSSPATAAVVPLNEPQAAPPEPARAPKAPPIPRRFFPSAAAMCLALPLAVLGVLAATSFGLTCAGKFLLNSHQTERALTVLKVACLTNPLSFDAQFQKARADLHLIREKYSDLHQIFYPAGNGDPDNDIPLEVRDGLFDASKAIMLNPRSDDARLLRAEIRRFGGTQIDLAYADVNPLKVDPEKWKITAELAFLSMDNPMSAEQSLRNAIIHGADQPDVWRALFEAQTSQGNDRGALQTAQDGLSRFPGNPDLLVLQAQSNRRLANWSDAASSFKAAIARGAVLEYDDVVWYVHWLTMHGQYSEAISIGQKVENSTFSDNSDLTAQIALANFYAGNYNAALAGWGAGLVQNPKLADEVSIRMAQLSVYNGRSDSFTLGNACPAIDEEHPVAQSPHTAAEMLANTKTNQAIALDRVASLAQDAMAGLRPRGPLIANYPNPVTEVSLTLNAQGHVTDSHFLVTSNNASFDQTAMEASKRAAENAGLDTLKLAGLNMHLQFDALAFSNMNTHLANRTMWAFPPPSGLVNDGFALIAYPSSSSGDTFVVNNTVMTNPQRYSLF